MRFLSVYKTAERSVPPTQEEFARMGKLVEDGMKAGYLLAVEGCMPSATGARVRLSNSKITVTDGPFTESKELIGGLEYWIREGGPLEGTLENEANPTREFSGVA